MLICKEKVSGRVNMLVYPAIWMDALSEFSEVGFETFNQDHYFFNFPLYVADL